jgi:gliding motility-associated-like protein
LLLPLLYASSNPSVATISPQGNIHILSAGQTSITVYQQGNTLYIAAIPRSQTLTVSMPIVPLVTISSSTTTVCTGSSVTYTAVVSNVNTNVSYQWQVNNVNKGSNTNLFTYVPVSNSDIVKCIVTNNNSCLAIGTSDPISVPLNPQLNPSVVVTGPPNPPFCSNVPLTFTALATQVGVNPVYQWKVNNLNAGINSNTFTSASLANGDVISCVISVSDPCSNATSITSNLSAINILPTPSIAIIITASANKVYAGTPITITAATLNTGNLNTFQWYVNGTIAGTNSSSFSSSSFKNGDVITCMLSTNITCSSAVLSMPLELIILPQLEITMSNTFTPNGDGVNDYWNIPALVNYPNCIIRIFNRYGNEVYQSKGYQAPWDGNSKGESLPGSTYYFVITPSATHKQLSGSVTIIR